MSLPYRLGPSQVPSRNFRTRDAAATYLITAAGLADWQQPDIGGAGSRIWRLGRGRLLAKVCCRFAFPSEAPHAVTFTVNCQLLTRGELSNSDGSSINCSCQLSNVKCDMLPVDFAHLNSTIDSCS